MFTKFKVIFFILLTPLFAKATGTLAFTINNTGLTSLTCDGKSYWTATGQSNVYIIGGTTYFAPSAVITSDNSTYIQYAFQPNGAGGIDKATLRITYTAQANCTLRANISWTNNDATHTLTRATVIPWTLTVGSDTISTITPQNVDIQGQCVYFINFTTGSIAMWQDFVNNWEQISTATWTTGATDTNTSQYLTVGVADYAALLTTYSPNIAPSGSVNYNMFVRFGSTTDTPQSLAPEAAIAFQAIYPPKLQPNRSRVAIAFISNPNSQTGNNPRGYLFVPGNNVYNPATGALGGTVVSSATTYANTVLTNATVNMIPKAQSVIIWDPEGQEFLQPMSYIGDPTQYAQFSPETSSFLDTMVNIWIAAGLKIGVLIRPQQTISGSGVPPANCAFNVSNHEYNQVYINTAAFTYPSITRDYTCTGTNAWTAQPATGTGYQQSQVSLALIESVLDAKVDALISRWGLSNLLNIYIDSAVYVGGAALDAAIYQHLSTRYPTLNFIPEEAGITLAIDSTASPYQSLGNTHIPRTTDTQLAQMPGMYSFIDASNQIIGGTYNTEIVKGIQNGDMYGQNAWFGTGEFTPMNALYTTAAINNSSLTITDSSTTRLHSFSSNPSTDGPIATYQRITFADTAANLNSSTTYCIRQAAVSCYNSGTLQAIAALDLSAKHFWRLEYWYFNNVCAFGCKGTGNPL